MNFRKYMHVERLNTTAVNGINDGMCYIFPKIDGTNSSVWVENGVIKAGSRNRELSLENDNAGFYAWVLNQKGFVNFFNEFPYIILYGEWLVPHTLKTYNEGAWKNFYCFDVYFSGCEKYLMYETYTEMLEKHTIEYIPAICKIKNPSDEKLYELLEKNTFLIKDGSGTGEGIVIKNYNFRNRFGNTVWAKIVKNEFKSHHSKTMGIPEIKESQNIEQKIINKFLTENLIRKEFEKIALNGFESKNIPEVLNRCYYVLLTEEIYEITKYFKNPVIDFKLLMKLSINKCKEVLNI